VKSTPGVTLLKLATFLKANPFERIGRVRQLLIGAFLLISGLDRKISVRATREELIERGILLPDVASVACLPQDNRFRDKTTTTTSNAATTTATTAVSSSTSTSTTFTANGE